MGGTENDGLAPERFAVKLNILFVLVIADCVCAGFADHLWDPSDFKLNIVLLALPFALHFAELLVFFFLVGHTFLMKYGLMLEMWNEFTDVCLFSFLKFAALMAIRLPRLMALVDHWKIGDFWDNAMIHALFFVSNIVTVIYDAWLLRKCHSLARVRFYKPHLWHKHKRLKSTGTVPGISSTSR